LARKAFGNCPHGRPRRRCVNNTKMNEREFMSKREEWNWLRIVFTGFYAAFLH
jgi:hypothetical protein